MNKQQGAQKIKFLKLQLSAAFVLLAVVLASGIFIFTPLSWRQVARALTGNYSKNSGDQLMVSDWNNLLVDFLSKDGGSQVDRGDGTMVNNSMRGDLDMGTNNITNVGSINTGSISGHSVNGDLNMNGNQITNLADPTDDGDAVNQRTLNTVISGAISAVNNIKDKNGNLKVFCGRTPPGATNWVSYWGGAYTDIDISGAGFTAGSMPYIFTSIGGMGEQWYTRGVTSISAIVPSTLNGLDTHFRVYVINDSGLNFTQSFVDNQWFVNWCAFGY